MTGNNESIVFVRAGYWEKYFMEDISVLHAKIMIADDERGNVQILERILGGAGYINILSISDSSEVPRLYREFQLIAHFSSKSSHPEQMWSPKL